METTNRVVNFSAGPAVLPEEVLQQAASEMMNWHGSGTSVLEMSHRSKEFISIAEAVERDIREILGVPANYKILLLQGGASQQFALVPMNLLGGKPSADYVNTGEWAKKAIEEAQNLGAVNTVASSQDKNFSYIPEQASWKLDPHAAYVHITSNETIGGIQYNWTPDTGGVPLVADMSSELLSRPFDITRYGLVYAGAQKNLGAAGLTIVIVRDDLLGRAPKNIPKILEYKTHADAGSAYHTPPTYPIYITGLVLQWLKSIGGLAAIAKRNQEKAAVLYGVLDQSKLFRAPARKQDRSVMNVTFTLPEQALEDKFLKGAEQRGMVQLKGHRSVGGMRASIYNAMPLAGVQKLAAYMREFEGSL